MSSSIADQAGIMPVAGKRLNPAELKIDLFCRGLLIDGTCRIKEEGRPVCCHPGDFASGLELILPGEIKELWVNVPIREKFVEDSPYHLRRRQGAYRLFDERHDLNYSVKLAPKPEWYDLQTARGTPMSRIGMLQGTFLAIDFGEPDRFWFRGRTPDPSSGGKAAEPASFPAKSVEDVVETAAAAQKKSRITFALLRGGSLGAGGLAGIFPYVQALKQEVGILVGVQFPPEEDLSVYERARSLGVDHFSFWFECFNQNHLDRFAPAAAANHRRERSMRALEYCARIMGKGRVSGELIAGIEPVEDTLRSIEYFVGVGALPLISIFRPLRGTEMENLAPPDYAEMLRVFRHVYQSCRAHNLPLGIAPNIRLSALPHPEDTLYLEPDLQEGRAYQRWIFTLQQMMRPYFLRRMRKRTPPQA
jgi:hypothetical protein